MEQWPTIPDDVVSWFRGVFSEANRAVCERLANVPNIRETSLDDALIEALIPDSAPTLLPSGTIVRMDTHNIGGLRRLGDRPWDWDGPIHGRWETADIGVLVFIYRGPVLVAKKIGLLQSKRLYPDNNDVDDADEVGFRYGMNAFIRREDQQALGALHRKFTFTEHGIYGAVHAGHRQIKLIDDFNRQFGKAIYYLLYNPHVMPLSVTYPLRERIRVEQADIGCRVFRADDLHAAISNLREGASPTYSMLKSTEQNTNWPLEKWAADMLLTCQVGEQFDASHDDLVYRLLSRRSGPIGAALAISITLPD